jgi:hypothetical protein
MRVPLPLEPMLGAAQPKPNVRKTLDTTDLAAKPQKPSRNYATLDLTSLFVQWRKVNRATRNIPQDGCHKFLLRMHGNDSNGPRCPANA